MIRRKLLLLAIGFTIAVILTFVLGPQANGDPSPNFEGVWNSATATPLQRPQELADKPFFTPEEAAEWERQLTERNVEPPSGSASTRRGTGTFNTVYREYGTRVVKTLRTSIITDPPDGRIPSRTPAAAEKRRQSIERQRRMENPEDLSLQDRCVAFTTSGPPMLPYTYNSNYQIIQTADAIVVHSEMIHDARIIHLDGRSHPPASIRLLSGYSVGRWEDDTLVVDTRNFDDSGGFYGSTGGDFSWDRNLHIVERFSFYDPNTLLYQFEIDNPTAFTQPWRGELTLTRGTGNIYEYACHEGNYSLTGMLRGARSSEQRMGR